MAAWPSLHTHLKGKCIYSRKELALGLVSWWSFQSIINSFIKRLQLHWTLEVKASSGRSQIGPPLNIKQNDSKEGLADTLHCSASHTATWSAWKSHQQSYSYNKKRKTCVCLCLIENCFPHRDPRSNSSGLQSSDLEVFRTLEEITGSSNLSYTSYNIQYHRHTMRVCMSVSVSVHMWFVTLLSVGVVCDCLSKTVTIWVWVCVCGCVWLMTIQFSKCVRLWHCVHVCLFASVGANECVCVCDSVCEFITACCLVY